MTPPDDTVPEEPVSEEASTPGEPTPEEPTSDDPAPARRARTVPAGAFVIAVMAAMALAVLAVVALTWDRGAGGDSGEVREARLAAGRFAETFLTFEHDALDDWKADVLRLSTAGFADEVEEVESGLRTLIAESELDAITQVSDVFVGELDRGAIEAVVVYERELRGRESARTESDRYLQLTLVRLEGEWLVDEVIDIATAGAPLAPEVDGPG